MFETNIRIRSNGPASYSYSIDFSEGVIVLIHKKGERNVVANYRPITLLNTDVKLVMGVVQLRLAKWIAQSGCISPEQLGFIEDRQLFDAVLTILDAQAYAAEVGEGMALVSVDFQNAYDKLDRGWLYKALAALGVGQRLVLLIRALHEGSRCCVLFNKWRTRFFSVLSGVRQGDPSAPLLFIFALQPLIFLVTRSVFGRLDGAPAPSSSLQRRPKVVSYADDATFLTASILSVWCFDKM